MRIEKGFLTKDTKVYIDKRLQSRKSVFRIEEYLIYEDTQILEISGNLLNIQLIPTLKEGKKIESRFCIFGFMFKFI